MFGLLVGAYNVGLLLLNVVCSQANRDIVREAHLEEK